jgi:glycosyltransferase involved in cell wall biosynthesis
MMKILIVINEYPPYGLCGYPLLCEEVVRELNLRGYKVHVLTGKAGCNGVNIYEENISRILEFCPHNIKNEPDSYRLLDLFRWYKREWFEQVHLKKLLRQFNPDVISMWTTRGLSYSVGITLMNQSIPFTGYVSGWWLTHHNQGAEFRKQYQFWQWNSNSVVLNSIKKYFKQFLLLQIPIDFQTLCFDRIAFNTRLTELAHKNFKTCNQSTDIICDSIPVEPFLAQPLPDLSKPRKIVFIGRIEPYKGLLTLIKACTELQKVNQFFDLELSIIGWKCNLDYFEKIEYAIAKSPFPEAYHFIDAVDYKELPSILSKYNLMVVPSIDDPLPRSSAEALAAGLPLIVSDSTGIASIVEHGKTALIFPTEDSISLANKIRLIMEDSQLACQLQENGRVLAKRNFSTERMVDELEPFFKSCITECQTHLQIE